MKLETRITEQAKSMVKPEFILEDMNPTSPNSGIDSTVLLLARNLTSKTKKSFLEAIPQECVPLNSQVIKQIIP